MLEPSDYLKVGKRGLDCVACGKSLLDMDRHPSILLDADAARAIAEEPPPEDSPPDDAAPKTDAEADEKEGDLCCIEIDILDVPRDQFLVAGRAWQLCRAGQANPDDFGLAPDSMHGLWYVQSQLVRDLAAVNKMELLCWDCWGLGHADPDEHPSPDDTILLDRVAAVTQARNEAFPDLRAIYEHNQQLRVPPVIISYTGAGTRRVDLTDR